MGNRFASAKNSIAICDRCGFQYQLKQLKTLVIKTKRVNMLVCPTCWEPDQPQLQLGMYPVDDPQAVRNPRKDTSYYQAGLNGLQLETGTGSDTEQTGVPTMGSRVIQWGWNPVGLNDPLNLGGLENDLVGVAEVGTVTVQIS